MRRLSYEARWFAVGLMLVVLVPTSTRAQDSRIGIRAGLLASNVASETAPNGDQLGETDGIRGFTIGALYELRGVRWFGRVEANYSPKGFTALQEQAGAEIDANIGYIDIPLFFGARLGTGDLVPSVYAGPWIAFEAGCSLTARAGTLEQDVDCDDPDGLSERNSTDWGVAFGAGLEYTVKPGFGLFADGRWSPGLSNLDTASDDENVNAKTRAWTVAAGATVRIGGS